MKARDQILWVFLMAGICLFVALGMAQAYTITAANMAPVGNLYFNESCPATITFKGSITLSSQVKLTNPVEVKYRFTRSDGATDTNVKTLMFTQPGSQDVSTTWTVGSATMPYYCGWVGIEIISPQSVNQQGFTFLLVCSNGQQPKFEVSDIFTIVSPKCDIGFKIKNIGGVTLSNAWINAGCPIDIHFIGTSCNGQTCYSVNIPAMNNIRNPGGEDTYTGYWPSGLLDFSKPFSLTLQVQENIGGPPPSVQTGSSFSKTKNLQCIIPSVPHIPVPATPLPKPGK